jgi:VWFA-related protein
MRIPAFSALAASLLLAVSAAAQQSAPPSPGSGLPSFKKAPPQVVMTVTVRDKHGNLVPGLKADDFTLTEDSRTQAIQSFSQQSDVPLLLGVMVDTSSAVMPAMPIVGKAAQNFLAQMLPASEAPGSPQAFVLHFDNEVELLRDFTGSREKLDSELAQLEPTAREAIRDQGPETHDTAGEWGGGPDKASHGGAQLFDAIYLASNDLMKPKQGRKALIVFSAGVDRSSKETQSEAIDAAEHAGASVYTLYFRGGQEKLSDFPGMDRRNGGGYPGGPGGYPGGPGGYPGGGYPGGGYPGGQPGGNPQRAPVDGKKVMQDIARRTGGEFYEAKRSVNLSDIYDQLAKLLHAQYVLAYTPDQPDDEGGYHKVVLTPKNKDLHVTMREGYYAPGGKD